MSTAKAKALYPWEYSVYRATLKRNGKFFALVTPNGNDALGAKEKKTLLDALSAEQELKEVHMELSRLTGCATNSRNWRTMLSRLVNKKT